MRLKFLFISVIIFFFSCKNAESENINAFTSDVKLLPLPEKAMPTSQQKAKDLVRKKIIKKATLDFETNDLESTYQQILKSTETYAGTIQNDSEGKEYNQLYKSLTIRVPADHFDPFIISISKGVAYFDVKTITAADVTAQYIDLDARLRAKKTLENRYLELLKKANTVADMLQIEAQLAAIREEVEAKQGEMNYLQDQVAESTINVRFYKIVASESGLSPSIGSKIWIAFTAGFNSFSDFLIGLLSVWPFALLAVALLYYVRKKIKKRNNA
jgi:hypothetical protein